MMRSAGALILRATPLPSPSPLTDAAAGESSELVVAPGTELPLLDGVTAFLPPQAASTSVTTPISNQLDFCIRLSMRKQTKFRAGTVPRQVHALRPDRISDAG